MSAVNGSNTVVVNMSIGVSALQFCGVLLMHTVKVVKEYCAKKKQRRGYANIERSQRIEEPRAINNDNVYAKFRDSILEDVQ